MWSTLSIFFLQRMKHFWFKLAETSFLTIFDQNLVECVTPSLGKFAYFRKLKKLIIVNSIFFSFRVLDYVRLKSYGSRAFSVAAPKHWNEIPLDIKLSRSVDVFKSRLKTYLFRLAFNWLFVLLLLLVRYLLDCKAI